MKTKKQIHSLKSFTIILLLFLSINLVQLSAQDILANPSFEILGSGGNFFGGWDQFNEVSSSDLAFHGNYAAQVSGIESDEWTVSAFWQQINCDTSEQWDIGGYVLNSQNAPLTGGSAAIINVEWYYANGEMIDYESFTVADQSTAIGEYIEFSLTSSPAPSGSAYIHLLTGILQSSDEPPAEIIYDQITCYSTTYPTIDDVQWNDFPDNRVIDFAGRSWRVKGTGWYGPGPNNFSHTEESVWIDNDEDLHLTIKNISGTWYCTEVVIEEALGYGDYIFTTRGNLNTLDNNSVLGLFIWQYETVYDPANVWWNPYNEIDVEFSRWGTPNNQIGQFVAQPWDWEGNLIRFDADFEENQVSSHAFNWQPDIVEFRSWYGDAEDESPENVIFEWDYSGPHIPRPEQPRVHINLWQFGTPPAQDQEVNIDDFTFIAENTQTHQNELVAEVNNPYSLSNYPNPFNPVTTISFELAESQRIKIEAFNLKGQNIETIVNRNFPDGKNSITWNAADYNSGIYFIRLSTVTNEEFRKAILLK